MKNLFDPPKYVNLTLVGLDGNAFALLGTFGNAARKQGWTQAEISTVQDEAMSGDYDHLLRVLSAHCQ